MARASVLPMLAVRGSEGISILRHTGTSLQPADPVSHSPDCRVFAFSPNGSTLAWCDGTSVHVLDLDTGTLKCSISRPKVRHLQFSPLGTYLAIWEPYTVNKDAPQGTPNLQIWTSEMVAEFTQKKVQNWCPQWSEDEQLCARNVTNEVHCFDGGQPDRSVSCKLRIEGLTSFAVSRGNPPYKIAVYVPGSKGAPSFVRLYEYPRLEGPGTIVASKSFYRADSVNFNWNKKGTAVLVVTMTDVDKTGASYYGEQGLHYLSSRGDGNMVPLAKKGPIYAVEWNPNSEEFCAVYGFMPSKATLFNCKCEPVFDFGTGHRNVAHFNPHGNILCLAGFGNLRGNTEFWDRKELKLLSKPQASDSTQFEWCPDGIHVVTATTAPRLREGNGLKVWHFKGSLVYQQDTPPKRELWEVRWRPFPAGTFPIPDTTTLPPPSTVEQPMPQAKAAAYRPPALRGKPSNYKLHEEEPPQNVSVDQTEKLSKSAMKNKRKRESKQKGKQQEEDSGGKQEQRDAVSLAAHLFGGSTSSTGSVSKGAGEGAADVEKKLKNLIKKLRQIEHLKQQQAEGKEMESNQMEKISSESKVLEEIAKLELT